MVSRVCDFGRGTRSKIIKCLLVVLENILFIYQKCYVVTLAAQQYTTYSIYKTYIQPDVFFLLFNLAENIGIGCQQILLGINLNEAENFQNTV